MKKGKNLRFLLHLKLQNLRVCGKWLVEPSHSICVFWETDHMHIFLVYYFNCSFHFITVHLLLCLIYINFTTGIYGLPRWYSGQESASQSRRRKRCVFNPRVGKIPLEEGMATHPRILAWKNSIEEHGRLRSMESQRVGHDWVTELMT